MFLIWLVLALAPRAEVTPGLGEGFWHTHGSQILDSADRDVRIAGINWYGFETTKGVPGGLDVQDYRTILQTIKKDGYNTIRIPFSSQMIESPIVPTPGEAIKFSNHAGAINSDLRGLDSLQILDRIVAYAGAQGLKVILDNHRSEAGGGPEATGLWYTQTYPESSWIADWQMLAHRYASDSAVLGFDLRNEPHNASTGGACWDCGGANDWRLAAERAGNAVLAVNPKLLIFVEGVDGYENDFYWWGGNLMGVRTAPVRLNVSHQLVYSAHDYGPAESGQPWFTQQMSAESLNAVWTKHWGYIAQEKIAPVWLGEFGLETPAPGPNEDKPTVAESMEFTWFKSLVSLLAREPRINWTYWALNGSDRYGLMNSNYDDTRGPVRQQALAMIQSPLGIRPAGGARTIVERVRSAAKASTGTKASIRTPASTGTQAETPAAPPVQRNSGLSGENATTPPVHAASGPVTRSQPAATASLQCRVSFTNLSDWKSGFTSGIVLHNTGITAIESWTLTFAFDGDQKISQVWNGRLDQQGSQVSISDEMWNATIAPGSEQAGIGFNASYDGTNRAPAKFYLNGTLCK